MPESTFLSPVNVCVSSSLTSVSADASSPPPLSSDPPQAATASASAASSDSRSAGRRRIIGKEAPVDGESDGRRLCCSGWRTGRASLASDHGLETNHQLCVHCAGVCLRRRGRACREEEDGRERAAQALRARASIDQATYDADRAILADVKRRIKRLTGTPQGPARGRARHHRGHGRSAASCAPARLTPLFLTLQRNAEWWSTNPLLGERRARLVPRLRAGLAVLPRPGPPAPPARQLRQAQRVREGLQAQQRAQHGAAGRAAVDRRPARRRARVGVLLHVRRRRAAVGQRARAGHRAAGDRALGREARPRWRSCCRRSSRA